MANRRRALLRRFRISSVVSHQIASIKPPSTRDFFMRNVKSISSFTLRWRRLSPMLNHRKYANILIFGNFVVQVKVSVSNLTDELFSSIEFTRRKKKTEIATIFFFFFLQTEKFNLSIKKLINVNENLFSICSASESN